jgi:hypothetical protein
MMVRITPNLSQWDSAIDRLGRDFGKAIERGVNRTSSNAVTVLVRDASEDLGLKQKDVRPLIATEKASAKALRWSATIYASPKRIPLSAFRATGPNPSRGKGGGISARLPTGKGRYPHAFFATVHGPFPNGVISGGHFGVFERVAKARNPIRQLFGPSVWHVIEKHLSAAETRALEMLNVNIGHEVQFLISQLAI